MTREDFIKNYDLEDETIILEPWEDFSGGIVGITEDHKQIIYSYQGMIESLLGLMKKNTMKIIKMKNTMKINLRIFFKKQLIG